MISIKKIFLIILLSKHLICFSQNNSFFIGINPNITFSKVTKQDELNGSKILPWPGLSLEFGYGRSIVKNKLFIDLSLNLLARSYAFKYNNNSASSQHGQLYFIPEIKLSYLKLLNQKNTLSFSLSYNQFLESENSTTTFVSLSNNISDTTSKTFTTSNGYAPCLGLGIGNFHKLKKRYCYYGITYFYGLSSFSKTKIEVYKNNTTYYSEVASRLSYLSFDFKIYFKKHKEGLNKID